MVDSTLPEPCPRPLGPGRSRLHRQDAQSMVEFALIAPLFFLLIFTVLEAALMLNAQITLDNAVREGARVAGMCGSSKAAFVEYNGQKSFGPAPCRAATEVEVGRNTGILKVITPNINPSVGVCSPPPASGRCLSGYTGATRGAEIQVDATYKYTFYLYPFLGGSAPSTNLSSTAQVVSQQ